MAVFIPEWSRLSARDLQIRKVLASLDDGHVVRRPLRPGCPADVFIQHREKGWLAVAVSDVTGAELSHTDLFEGSARQRLDEWLQQLKRLGGPGEHGVPRVAVLVVMWKCSTQALQPLAREVLGRIGLRMVSRERFDGVGPKLVQGLLAPLDATDEAQLLAAWFPEAEVPVACTTRRFQPGDNAASLGRHFLDIDQEWAAKLDLELPHEQREVAADFSVRLLNGVAGSGKTLIAVQRALLLAELFPRQRILLLIHNTPIVADLKVRLRRAGRELPANVEMMTFFAWIHRQWRRAFGAPPRMPDDPQAVADLVQHHRVRWPGLKCSTAQLVAELDFIHDAMIADEAGYLAASRAGRRFALGEAERRQAWALCQAVKASLHRRETLLWSELPFRLCLARERHASLERHDHVLVDEAQFFAPSWFEVVKLCLAPRGQLFLCADPNQGFLKQRLSWKSAGLDVAGRTKRLRRSYRTTKAILQAAGAVLDVLGHSDDDDFLQPDYAGMETGVPPLLARAASPQDAVERLCNELAAAHAAGAPLDAFLVVYGDNVNRQVLHAALCRRFGASHVWWLNERDHKRGPPGAPGRGYLRMAYLATATGLEGSITFLVGIENLLRAGAAAGLLSDEERHERREESARKLYMAMTRAARRLVVVASQPLPAALESVFEVAPAPDEAG